MMCYYLNVHFQGQKVNTTVIFLRLLNWAHSKDGGGGGGGCI